MIPEDRLSTDPEPGTILGGRGQTVSAVLDYETGGIGIADSSQGLWVQVWRGRLVSGEILLDVPSNPSIPVFSLFSGTGITEFSFSFDQLMRPLVVFVQEGRSKMYWFNPITSGYGVTDYGSAVINPRLSLDDKRPTLINSSDVIFAYVKNSTLCFRLQRERFEVERTLVSGVSGLAKLGMSDKNRLQFETT